jgi:tetratricopeptide (TPR) repeat protein
MTALVELVERLRLIEGPKTLILISEGFIHNEETGGYFRQLARVAAAARVNLYAVVIDAPKVNVSHGRSSQSLIEDMNIRADGMATLAGMTRGAMFRVGASANSPFVRIERELAGYYLLGFHPEPGERDGESHQIVVRAKGAKDLTIRARAELIISVQPSDRSDIEQLRPALRAPFLRTDLPLSVTTYSLGVSDTLGARVLIVSAFGTDVTLAPSATVAFVLLDEWGNIALERVDRVSRRGSAVVPTKALRYVCIAEVPPGSYTLKLAAIDDGGRVGSVEHPVNAELTTAGGMELSDLLLAEGPGELFDNALIAGPGSLDGHLQAYLEIHSEDPALLQGITVLLEVADDKRTPGRVHTTGSVKQSEQGRWIVEGTLDLRLLPPGDYVARALVTRDGLSVATIVRPFRLDREDQPIATPVRIGVIPAGPARNYVDLLKQYKGGDFIRSAKALSKMPQKSVAEAKEYFERGPLTQADLKTAALLHTDVVLITGEPSSFHLDAARRFLERIPDASNRRAFQRQWFLTVAFRFQILGFDRDALAFLDAARHLFPNDTKILLTVGAINEAAGWMGGAREHIHKAERYYRRILKSEPDSVEAHLRLGHVLKLKGHEEDALREVNWAFSHAEDRDVELVALILLGDIQRAGDDLREAINSYRAAVTIAPVCQAAVTALSHALHQSGDIVASRDVLDQFFERKGTLAGGFDGWWRYIRGDPRTVPSMMAKMRQELQ